MDAHARYSEPGYHSVLPTLAAALGAAWGRIRGFWTSFRDDCGCDDRKARLLAVWHRLVGG